MSQTETANQPHPEVNLADVLAARVAAGEPLFVMIPSPASLPADHSLVRHGEQFYRGHYGITSPRGNPLCEECDLEMAPFAGPSSDDGKTIREGWSCIGCGWSIDRD